MDADSAAAHFGVDIVAFIGHSANAHWLVAHGTTELVLRRFRTIRSLEYARYEVTLLSRLKSLGHPVPTIVEEPVELEGFVWFLMTKVPGVPGS